MTAEEHIAEAERLLDMTYTGGPGAHIDVDKLAAIAQAHAAIALAIYAGRSVEVTA